MSISEKIFVPSPKLSRRQLVIGGALAAASAISFARLPTASAAVINKQKFNSWMPESVGPWKFVTASGVVLPPPDALSDRLYDNLVTRVYSAEGAPSVMLLIAYNNIQDGVLQVHRPEICYPAGGFSLAPTKAVVFQNRSGQPVPGNYFTATGPDHVEHVLYWTRVGGSFPRTWLEQRLAVADANLRGVIPDGVLARVSLVGAGAYSALDLLRKFVVDLEQASPTELRRVLMG